MDKNVDNKPDCSPPDTKLATLKDNEYVDSGDVNDSNLDSVAGGSMDVDSCRGVSSPFEGSKVVVDPRVVSVPVVDVLLLVKGDPERVIMEPDLLGVRSDSPTMNDTLTEGQRDFLGSVLSPERNPGEMVVSECSGEASVDEGVGESGRVLRSAKRKSEKRGSPLGKDVLSMPSRSDSEDIPLKVRLTKKRRIINFDEDVPDDAVVMQEAVEKGAPTLEAIQEPDDVNLTNESGNSGRSSKKVPSVDSMEMTFAPEGSLDPDFVNVSINSIGGKLFEYLTEIDKLRTKSKKLKGPISERIKQLIKCSKDALTVITGRCSGNVDVSYLRMRNKELLINNKVIEDENEKLKKQNVSLKREIKLLKEQKKKIGTSVSTQHEIRQEEDDVFLPPPSGVVPAPAVSSSSLPPRSAI